MELAQIEMQPIQKDKKTGIVYRAWRTRSPEAILLLVHGLGAHTDRWEFLENFFLKNDVSVYAIELKGFGETEGLRGHVDSFDIYLEDILHLYGIAAKENSGKKVFLLGESMGALIAFVAVVVKPDLFSGLISLSPAFKSRLGENIFNYVKYLSPNLYNPKKQFSMPFDSEMCTRDVDYQKVLDRDAERDRLATSKLLLNILITQMRSWGLKTKVRIPVLFLLAGDDKIVNPEVSKEFFKNLKAKDKKIIEYPGMRHALSIDLGREAVFGDILKWIEARVK